MIGLKFGSFDMQANGVRVTGTDVYSAPPNKIQADALAESDGAIIVKQQYDSKTFTVEGLLRADSIAALETLIDTFKVAMSVKNQAFDLEYGGSIRRYLASYQNMVIAKQGISSASFSVQLLSPDGVGWDVDSTSLADPTGITTSNVTTSVTVGGSYMAEPLIVVAINTVTGGTAKTVTISNSSTLRGISVTRDWADGDTLEIDSMKKTVYVNDVIAEFSGQFPTWQSGDGGIQYLDDFTARDVTLSASYTRRWL